MIDRERLVADALAAVSIPSFTGSEEAMAAYHETFASAADECGDSVVVSQVDRVHRSGVALARTLADGLSSRSERSAAQVLDRGPQRAFEAHA